MFPSSATQVQITAMKYQQRVNKISLIWVDHLTIKVDCLDLNLSAIYNNVNLQVWKWPFDWSYTAMSQRLDFKYRSLFDFEVVYFRILSSFLNWHSETWLSTFNLTGICFVYLILFKKCTWMISKNHEIDFTSSSCSLLDFKPLSSQSNSIMPN